MHDAKKYLRKQDADGLPEVGERKLKTWELVEPNIANQTCCCCCCCRRCYRCCCCCRCCCRRCCRRFGVAVGVAVVVAVDVVVVVVGLVSVGFQNFSVCLVFSLFVSCLFLLIVFMCLFLVVCSNFVLFFQNFAWMLLFWQTLINIKLRFEFAMSIRGTHSWILKDPDCTVGVHQMRLHFVIQHHIDCWMLPLLRSTCFPQRFIWFSYFLQFQTGPNFHFHPNGFFSGHNHSCGENFMKCL